MRVEKKKRKQENQMYSIQQFHCMFFLLFFFAALTCNFDTFPYLFVGVSSILPVSMLLFQQTLVRTYSIENPGRSSNNNATT